MRRDLAGSPWFLAAADPFEAELLKPEANPAGGPRLCPVYASRKSFGTVIPGDSGSGPGCRQPFPSSSFVLNSGAFRPKLEGLSPSEQPDFTLALRNLVLGRPPVIGAARVNRSLERTASGENMTFSWTEPFTIGVGEGWELLIYGQAVADHQGRSLAVFGLIACLNQRPFGCGVGGVGLLRQQVVLAGQPEIQPIRWAELNELAGWTNLRSDPFPGSPRLPPLPGGRVGPFLGFPVAKRVKSGASKSVNSGTLALARSLHDGP